jgi:hypothetical protein
VPVTAAETLASSATAFLAASIVGAYLLDWFGLVIRPAVVLLVALVSAVAVDRMMRHVGTRATGEMPAYTAIVVLTFGWLLWIARPSFLPPGRGPDLAHHLTLVDFIEQHRSLPHDPNLAYVLGEMIDYTPGMHLLGALAGAWTRLGGLHAAYPIVALTVALKAGWIFLIAARLIAKREDAIPFACVAVLLLFVPRTFFIRSFTDTSYLAQVVSEFFAIGMWWAIVAWSDRPSRPSAALFALAGAAAFLVWPVWLGPLALTFAIAIVLRRDIVWRERIATLAIAFAPITIVAAMYARLHGHAVGIVAVPGYVPLPTIATFGGWFLLTAAVGIVIAAARERLRVVLLSFLVAIGLQAAALFALARATHAEIPYQAVKMAFIAIYPLASAAALALAEAFDFTVTNLSRFGGPSRRSGPSSPSSRSRHSRLSRLSRPAIVLAIAIVALRPALTAPRPKPVVTEPLYQAGVWARTHVDPNCVDYLVDDEYSAYWLHLGVLRNARADPRHSDELFIVKHALVRWVMPGGRRYAIVEDLSKLPRDIRSNVDVLASFGPAAVVKRRGAASCE